jgi:hypothetical protein
MGPFLLGLSRPEVSNIVRSLGFKIENTWKGSDVKVYIEELDATFVFSAHSPQTLERIAVCDWRTQFGQLNVYGTPIHELVLLLKATPSETLWCDCDDFDHDPEQLEQVQAVKAADQELIESGTLWFTTLGLGVTLDCGTVCEVHVCNPERSPRFGTGSWTDAQGVLSTQTLKVSQSGVTARPNKKNPLLMLWFVSLMVAFGGVIWRSFELQKRWSDAPNVAATVIAVNPPAPEAFPREFKLSFPDASGLGHEVLFTSNDYSGPVKLGDAIPIRFMPEAPDKPIGPNHFSDRGLDFAMPFVIAIGVVYAVSQILLLLAPTFRKSLRWLSGKNATI